MKPPAKQSDPALAAGRAGALLLIPVMALALAACSGTAGPHHVGAIPDDYRVAHPIKIDEQIKTMDVPVGLQTTRLSPPVRGNIAGFARRFNQSGGSQLAIVVPSGSPNQAVAADLRHQIRDVLVRAGVGPNQIDFRSYSAGPQETGAPIRLAFAGITARVEKCGAWPDRLERNAANRNYGNFGCATQSNLAAMVDNPLDLVYPRDMTPADAGRRSTVLNAYRQGQQHSTRQSLDGGVIAVGVGN